MSDLFHEDVPLSFIQQVFQVMAACPQHTFQVLTKRSERLRELAPDLPWPTNVWMGVSIEDSNTLMRIADLQSTPAAVRFISCEPLLDYPGILPLDGMDWVIVGGESGPGSRVMEKWWVESIQTQCETANATLYT